MRTVLRSGSLRLATLLIGIAIGPASIARPLPDEEADAVTLLFTSDVLRARAQEARDPVLMIAALALAAEARGGLYAPGGTRATIDYDARWAEAHRLAEGKPDLIASLLRLPTPDRGASAGMRATQVTMPDKGVWRGTIRYDGAATALLYARSASAGWIHLTVRDGRANTLCDEVRKSGRILCRWTPLRTGPVSVTVTTKAPAITRFDLYTN